MASRVENVIALQGGVDKKIIPLNERQPIKELNVEKHQLLCNFVRAIEDILFDSGLINPDYVKKVGSISSAVDFLRDQLSSLAPYIGRDIFTKFFSYKETINICTLITEKVKTWTFKERDIPKGTITSEQYQKPAPVSYYFNDSRKDYLSDTDLTLSSTVDCTEALVLALILGFPLKDSKTRKNTNALLEFVFGPDYYLFSGDLIQSGRSPNGADSGVVYKMPVEAFTMYSKGGWFRARDLLSTYIMRPEELWVVLIKGMENIDNQQRSFYSRKWDRLETFSAKDPLFNPGWEPSIIRSIIEISVPRPYQEDKHSISTELGTISTLGPSGRDNLVNSIIRSLFGSNLDMPLGVYLEEDHQYSHEEKEKSWCYNLSLCSSVLDAIDPGNYTMEQNNATKEKKYTRNRPSYYRKIDKKIENSHQTSIVLHLTEVIKKLSQSLPIKTFSQSIPGVNTILSASTQRPYYKPAQYTISELAAQELANSIVTECLPYLNHVKYFGDSGYYNNLERKDHTAQPETDDGTAVNGIYPNITANKTSTNDPSQNTTILNTDKNHDNTNKKQQKLQEEEITIQGQDEKLENHSDTLQRNATPPRMYPIVRDAEDEANEPIQDGITKPSQVAKSVFLPSVINTISNANDIMFPYLNFKDDTKRLDEECEIIKQKFLMGSDQHYSTIQVFFIGSRQKDTRLNAPLSRTLFSNPLIDQLPTDHNAILSSMRGILVSPLSEKNYIDWKRTMWVCNLSPTLTEEKAKELSGFSNVILRSSLVGSDFESDRNVVNGSVGHLKEFFVPNSLCVNMIRRWMLNSRIITTANYLSLNRRVIQESPAREPRRKRETNLQDKKWSREWRWRHFVASYDNYRRKRGTDIEIIKKLYDSVLESITDIVDAIKTIAKDIKDKDLVNRLNNNIIFSEGVLSRVSNTDPNNLELSCANLYEPIFKFLEIGLNMSDIIYDLEEKYEDNKIKNIKGSFEQCIEVEKDSRKGTIHIHHMLYMLDMYGVRVLRQYTSEYADGNVSGLTDTDSVLRGPNGSSIDEKDGIFSICIRNGPKEDVCIDFFNFMIQTHIYMNNLCVSIRSMLGTETQDNLDDYYNAAYTAFVCKVASMYRTFGDNIYVRTEVLRMVTYDMTLMIYHIETVGRLQERAYIRRDTMQRNFKNTEYRSIWEWKSPQDMEMYFDNIINDTFTEHQISTSLLLMNFCREQEEDDERPFTIEQLFESIENDYICDLFREFCFNLVYVHNADPLPFYFMRTHYSAYNIHYSDMIQYLYSEKEAIQIGTYPSEILYNGMKEQIRPFDSLRMAFSIYTQMEDLLIQGYHQHEIEDTLIDIIKWSKAEQPNEQEQNIFNFRSNSSILFSFNRKGDEWFFNSRKNGETFKKRYESMSKKRSETVENRKDLMSIIEREFYLKTMKNYARMASEMPSLRKIQLSFNSNKKRVRKERAQESSQPRTSYQPREEWLERIVRISFYSPDTQTE